MSKRKKTDTTENFSDLHPNWKQITRNPLNCTTPAAHNLMYLDARPVFDVAILKMRRKIGFRIEHSEMMGACNIAFVHASRKWNGGIPWPIYLFTCCWNGLCATYRHDFRHNGRYGYYDRTIQAIGNDRLEKNTNRHDGSQYSEGQYGMLSLPENYTEYSAFATEGQHEARITLQEIEAKVKPEEREMWDYYKMSVTEVHGREFLPEGAGEGFRLRVFSTGKAVRLRWQADHHRMFRTQHR